MTKIYLSIPFFFFFLFHCCLHILLNAYVILILLCDSKVFISLLIPFHKSKLLYVAMLVLVWFLSLVSIKLSIATLCLCSPYHFGKRIIFLHTFGHYREMKVIKLSFLALPNIWNKLIPIPSSNSMCIKIILYVHRKNLIFWNWLDFFPLPFIVSLCYMYFVKDGFVYLKWNNSFHVFQTPFQHKLM